MQRLLLPFFLHNLLHIIIIIIIIVISFIVIFFIITIIIIVLSQSIIVFSLKVSLVVERQRSTLMVRGVLQLNNREVMIVLLSRSDYT